MLVYPQPIRVLEHEQIVLSDGTTLSALIWLPKDAEQRPVPGILEILPYRKRDGTAKRDARNHPYVAQHGYACIRVDQRGSGDSEGELVGEYLQQEQDDCIEIIQWTAAQTWCTGSVGMMGISWGGFNGLQVAALRPPELKAIISVCSTDDRYDNDIHYVNGCQLVDNFLWGATMMSVGPTPPDPALVGDKWRDMWLQRLKVGAPYMKEWVERQRRDAFWKHASICEDYSAVECPVYLMGGWQDLYRNSIFRMLEHLKCPKKGLVGPWAHAYANAAGTGPQIGFLQESIRWWDKWLKGKETHIMDEPMLRCYLQDPAPPQTSYSFRPGHWVAEESWPSPNVEPAFFGLAEGKLVRGAGATATSAGKVVVSSPQTVGFFAGRYLPYGNGDLPSDQRLEVGSTVFDSEPLVQSLDILGAAVVHLRLSSDKPNAFIAAAFSEVLPDGSATRLASTVFNLTHRDSHEDLKPLEPDTFYDVSFKLSDCGQRLGAGSVLRLALSTSYFPTVWPSPEQATLTIDCASSKLELPSRRESPLDGELKPFGPPIVGPPLDIVTLREGKSTASITTDLMTGEMRACYSGDDGYVENRENGWRWAEDTVFTCGVLPNDPLSAHAEQEFRFRCGRGELDLLTQGWCKMTTTKSDWLIHTRLEGVENGERIFEHEENLTIPRDHM